MSVDSTALERSALERKDRDELVTIAKALGGKPPARPRRPTSSTWCSSSPGSRATTPPRRPRPPPRRPTPRSRRRLAGLPAPARRGRRADRRARPSRSRPPSGRPRPAPPTSRRRRRASARRARRPRRPERPAGPPGRGGPQGRNGATAATAATATAATAAPAAGGQAEQAERWPGRRRRGRQPPPPPPRPQPRPRGRPRRQGQGGAAEEYTGEPIEVEGHLDLRDEGYGFLRIRGYLPSRDDVYVSVKQARQFGLRKGDHLKGASRPALRNEKNPALLRIDVVNGEEPGQGPRAPALRGPHPAVPRHPPHPREPVATRRT